MKSQKPSKTQFAICVNNDEYSASLELHKVYRVLPDDGAEQACDLRVIDESGEDYLYPAEYFLLVDLPRETAKALTHSLSEGAS